METVMFRDAAATENKSLPLHRWVPWIAGFSAQFVEDAIEAYLPRQNRQRHLVLDPFAGVATTMVEALKCGYNTLGYEINPFAALAARAKINCVDVIPQHFGGDVDVFLSSVMRFEKEVDRRWDVGHEDAIASLLRPLEARRPRQFRSRIPFFSPPVEAKFLYALGLTDALAEPHRSLFRVAFGATMVQFSNYTYEPSLSSRPGAGKPLIENASVAAVVCNKLYEMLYDMTVINETYGRLWRYCVRQVYDTSYFYSKLAEQSVSLVVTSPPYMNNYHYVRNTRPQLHWLNLLGSPTDLRGYEHESFGKFWQTVRQDKSIPLETPLTELALKVEHLRSLNVVRRQYGGPGWANYVVTYFNDAKRLMAMLKYQLKHGGYAVIVVGNSIIQGVEFKVDEYLAMLASYEGLKIEAIKVVRTKRVGNSIIDSSVRSGAANGANTGVQLYDAAVILRNP